AAAPGIRAPAPLGRGAGPAMEPRSSGFAASSPPSGSIEYLWPDGAPGALGDDERDRPSLEIHLAPPEQATGAAVVICPGGGYNHLATIPEGRAPAEWLNGIGVHAFVLSYRHAPGYHHPAPPLAAQRPLPLLRAR